jgi:hypothetical protein
VTEWLSCVGLSHCIHSFIYNMINGAVLVDATHEALAHMGLCEPDIAAVLDARDRLITVN